MKLALALVLSLASTPVLIDETSELTRLVINAYGGVEAIEGNKSFVQSGVLESSHYNGAAIVKRIYSRPNKLRIEIQDHSGKSESRILVGQRGWHNADEVPPAMVRSMYLQAARLDLPYLIMKAGESIKIIESTKSDDARDLKSLEVPMEDGLRLIAVINMETGYIVSSHGFVKITPDQEIEFTTLYSNHKELDGVVVAIDESQFVQGQPTGKTMLNKLEVIKDLEDAVFRIQDGDSI